ncbi:membrane protein insertase YidC [Companilactobacillus allii]|uniref:Membrane protein insertase YidC n=1 Tax=Companilactobacillus allii TaxID=1847728 RepID=A0A1P8Q165_9LACO|nr:membrane protein insertase YidC [Companilactobacillus allii]APX71576.1 OxaA precursor [Companilactobacillus allii]USQ68656.1 membrane protein insertase YidC [Companilactobacillus allii]
MNKKSLKKYLGVALLLSVVLVLAGCSNLNEPITSQSTGFWDHYILYSFSRFILWLASLVGNSYGWAIVLFTIVIRVILLPLNWFQIRSMNKQMQIQPQMKALQNKYSAKDVDTQQKLREETQKLYSEAGVNPVAGCLPLAVQMPVMFALYQAIYKTTQLRDGSFLWMQLGKADPYYIMAILAALFTFLSTYISSYSQPTQNATTKIMTYVMPIFIFVPALTFPSAITIYWVVTNAFQVLQTLAFQNPFKYRRERREKEEEEREKERKLRKAKKRVYKRRK